jgi:hypothetical protein
MELDAVRVRKHADALVMQRARLGPSITLSLAEALDVGVPTVFVVRDDDLPLLIDLPDIVVDRGVKQPSIELARRLLGHDRIPLVRGSYQAVGKIRTGLKALLSKAEGRGEVNVYLVSAAATVFESLWRDAPELDPLDGGPPAHLAPPSTVEAPESAPLLYDLMERLPVPAMVRQTYMGSSPKVELVRQLLIRASRRKHPVLILGDTGTGKELVARLVHDCSSRSAEEYVTVNAAAIPRELFESELFGHEKGAFSGAFRHQPGLWEAAHKGTLFLDEIGDLAQDHQVKILRALEEGSIRRVGGTEAIRVDVRVIAATNRDLYALMKEGTFREDLYYRLQNHVIRTPALRDHPEDIPALARSFWRSITEDDASQLPADVVDGLRSHEWPGNVRRLRIVLENLHSLFGAESLTVEHLHAVLDFQD